MFSKNFTAALLAIICFQTGSFAQFYQTDLQKANLKGRVKKVITIVGNLSPKEDNYNEQGNLISQIEISQNQYTREENVYRKEYVYNKNGLKTEEKEFNDDDKPESRIVFKYDVKNNPISQTSFNNKGKVNFQTTYQNVYDKKGWLAMVTDKTIFFDDKGKVREIWTTVTKYNSEKRVIALTRKDKTGKTLFQQSFKYDSKGTLIEKTEKDEWKNTITKSFPKYNAAGITEEDISYVTNVNRKITDTITQKLYYENNKLIKKTIQNAGSLWTEIYNENEQMISKQIGDDLFITFKYDKDGNWIEQVSTNSNKTLTDRYGNPLVVTSFREIEYY